MKRRFFLSLIVLILFSVSTVASCSSSPKGSNAKGKVLNSVSNEPVQGVTVTAKTKVDIEEDKKYENISTETDSSGEYLLKGLSPKYRYEIIASKEGFTGDLKYMEPTEANKTRLIDDLYVFKKEPVRGKVVDIDGNPVPEVKIYLPNSRKFVLTKEDGKFEIPIKFDDDIGSYRFSVWILNEKRKREWWMPNAESRNLKKQGCDFGEIKINGRFMKSADGKKRFGTIDGRFIDNRDGTVTDLKNNIMLLNTIIQNNSVDFRKVESYCKNLTYANYSDWRLPTKELLTDIASNENKSFFFLKSAHWVNEQEAKKMKSGVKYFRWSVDLFNSSSSAGAYRTAYCTCIRDLN